MTWTAPATAVTGNTLTAAFWNAQVRDNMLETAAATAAAAGDVVYADAANSMGSRVAHPGQSRMLVSDASNELAWRQPAEDVNFSGGIVSGTFEVTDYRDAIPAGQPNPGATLPSVTVTTGTLAIVILGVFSVTSDTTGGLVMVSYSVSGASTIGASDAHASRFESSNGGDTGPIALSDLVTLTAGSNTFQMEVKVSTGDGTVHRPRILVIPL